MNLGLLKKLAQNLPDESEIGILQTSERWAELLIDVDGELIKLTDIKFQGLEEKE